MIQSASCYGGGGGGTFWTQVERVTFSFLFLKLSLQCVDFPLYIYILFDAFDPPVEIRKRAAKRRVAGRGARRSASTMGGRHGPLGNTHKPL